MTMTTKNPCVVVTILNPMQYEAMAGPPPVVPTQHQLFDYQVEVLAGKGMATKAQLLPLAEFIPGSGLFLLVPPRPKRIDFDKRMALIELNGRQGANYLDASYLADEVQTPEGAYLALDLEDGRARLNIAPCDSKRRIAAVGRSPYVIFEAMTHATVFPMVLLHHYLDVVGSWYRTEFVPCVGLDDGEPGLNRHWDDDPHPGWGAPSCGSRKGLRA